jgi:hypothetical protein
MVSTHQWSITCLIDGTTYDEVAAKRKICPKFDMSLIDPSRKNFAQPGGKMITTGEEV